MKRIFLTLSILLSVCGLSMAQRRSNGNRPQVLPPQIMEDNSVVFQIRLPGASQVGVTVGNERFEMEKGDNGLWSVHTNPIVPGFHYYFLDIDGLQVNDPNSSVYYGFSKEAGGIEIPEPSTEDFEIRDVPHGTVSAIKYFSGVEGRWKELWVYTPAGYFSGKKKYPVLYLQHGGGENRTSWFKQGRAANILDNLIADGRATPMIVVCADGQMPASAGAGLYNWESMQPFREEMTGSIIPVVERQFRVKKGPRNRALCGLSMGGGQSFFVGLRSPDVFGSVAMLSAGVFNGTGGASADMEANIPGIYSNTDQFNKEHDLVFISCGEQDPRISGTRKYVEEMRSRGVDVIFHSYPGDHEWQPWRKSLRDLVQYLFK